MSGSRLAAGLLTALALGTAPAARGMGLGALGAAPALAAEQVSRETSATFSPSLLPAKAGQGASLKLRIEFSGGNFGVPAQVSRVVLHLPAGLRFVDHGVRACPKARLIAHGARGCPASERVGTGHALTEAHLGAANNEEQTNISAFLGPSTGGIPSIELVSQGETPLEERVVLNGIWAPDQAPYGESLSIAVPPIPTVPLEPNASTISMSVTIGVKRHGKVVVGLILPHKCPAEGLPFGAEFSYENGTSSHTTARVRCH
jgi:hypothetical protein